MHSIGMAIFFVGVLITGLFMLRSGLGKFDGTRYRTHLLFSLWMCLFLSAANYLMFQPVSHALWIGAGLGIVLTVPSAIWQHIWFQRRLHEDMVVRYPPQNYRRSLIRNLPILVVLIVLIHFVGIENVSKYSFFLVAGCVSWFLTTIYALIQVTRLEDRIGKHIFEESTAQ